MSIEQGREFNRKMNDEFNKKKNNEYISKMKAESNGGKNDEYTVKKSFTKLDKEKTRYELIPAESLESLAKVLTYGANKYSANNWKNCDDIDRYIGALYRHLNAYRLGKEIDEESGLPHVDHMLANALFVSYITKKR